MSLRLVFGFGAVVTALALAGCATPTSTREPRNLDLLKADIRAYVDSGDYQREIADVAARAKAWVGERAAKRVGPPTGAGAGSGPLDSARGGRLTVVIDLDETLLSNWPFMNEQDFGGTDAAWEAWYNEAKAPAIEPVREIYRTARSFGIEIYYITARHERVRAGTDKNLTAVGCDDYVALIMRPNDDHRTAAAFKTGVRQRLAAEGHVIIANVGDQESDLSGGFAERTFKLPDPFYLVK